MSFFDDASLAFLPSGAAGKDGKAYSIKPVPEYGAEKVTNGDFAADSDWLKDTGWTISGGSANCLNGQGVSIYQTNVVDIGKHYKLTFSVSNYSQGFLGSIGNDFGGVVADTYGSYEIFGTATSTTFGFSAFGSFIGSIDNVSVKEVLVGDGDFTFSRGSNLAATRVGADGLIEKGRENLFLYSNQFDTGWPFSNASVTSGQSGYDGSNDAWLLTASLAGGRIQLSRSDTGVNTTSAYFKKGSADGVWLRVDMSGTDANVYVNLIDGSKINSTGEIATKINDVGNGWYRVELTANWINVLNIRIYPTNTSGVAIAGSIYIQDAQLEIGLAATDYIESGATTGKAGLLEDEPRFDYSGGATCPSLLLEPSRTNLFGTSEYFNASTWSSTRLILDDNAETSPEGLVNATKMIPSTDNNTHFFYDSVPTTINESYTFSLFVKATTEYSKLSFLHSTAGGVFNGGDSIFDASTGTFDSVAADTTESVESYSNGWYRLILTQEALATGNGLVIIRSHDGSGTYFAGNGVDGIYIYGAQIEQGSYPTSYIPNHSGGSVTRGFDYSIVEYLGYSSTYTFYYEFNTTTGRETSSPFAEIGKDQSNKIWIKGASANGPQFSVQGNGIFSGSISPTNEVSGTNKIAVQWSSGVGVVFSNGVKQSGTLTNSNTSENIDFISAKGEGTSHDSKQLLFFEEALSDADCITLTTL